MANDREELNALRRLAELEGRSAANPTPEPSLLGFMAENRARNDELFKNGWGTGVPKFFYDLGGKVTDATGSPELGFAANVLPQALLALMSGYKLEGSPAQSLLQYPARKLMQSATKPTVADLESGNAGRAIDTMLQEGISPTKGGMEKAGGLISKLNSQVQSAVANSPAQISVGDVARRLNDPYALFRNQVTPQADLQAISNVANDFANNPQIAGQSAIPVQLAQQLKQGTYKALGAKSYGEVGTASTEAQKALARGLREEIASAVPQVVDPLKREAALMNVMDVAGRRALLEANKNPLGLAALRMDNPLSALTFLADRWAGLKALLARSLYTAGQPQIAAPSAVALPPALQARGALYQQQ